MFNKRFTESEAEARWPSEVEKLRHSFGSHERRYTTCMYSVIQPVQSEQLFSGTYQQGSREDHWVLQIETKKPGGKRFVYRGQVEIPPLQEDLEALAEAQRRDEEERLRFASLTPEEQHRERQQLLAELRKSPGFMELHVPGKEEE